MNIDTFRTQAFLTDHIHSILAFYEENVDDPHGGFYQNFLDDGSVYDQQTRHLVSSCRFVFNYARAYLAFGSPHYLKRVQSGLEFLRKRHLNSESGGYFWLLHVDGPEQTVLDDTNHCYGLAFVMLAYSWAFRAGIKEAKGYLEDTYRLLDKHFWDTDFELYKDEFTGNFTQCSAYRGQNANMHSCEALIAAFEATGEESYLNRALLLAQNMVNRQAGKTTGLVWEHYDSNWEPDWHYNKDDPKNLFRPWGFQPGHQTEWAKLLLMMYRHKPDSWLVERAQALFDEAIDVAWDREHKGICYGFAPDRQICDGEKYFWVQAESFACAARLAEVTGKDVYWQWYGEIWQYAWEHLVDHKYGAWYRILTQDNRKIDDKKSPIGKTDYHTLGACFDVLDVIAQSKA